MKTLELNKKHFEQFKIFNKNIKLNNINKLFKNFSNKTISRLPVKINGHNVLTIRVFKNLMTRDDIKYLSQNVSDEMKNLKIEGKIFTTLKFNENKYRSGKSSKFGEPIHIFNGIRYDFEDAEDDGQELFNSFNMYLIENGKPEGGATNDNNNNCFYECIKQVLKNNCPWTDAISFKKWLKIPYYEKVKMNDIEKIETFLKISINILGDYIYFTKLKNNNKVINLKLINEHYTLDNKPLKEIINVNNKISFYDKQPLIYNTTTFKAYDGKKEIFITKEERNNIYSWKTQYILINKSDNKNLTLQDEYNKFIEDANILKNETNNEINLYKTGNNKITALNLFYNYNTHIITDNIKQLEAEYINCASFGALMYAEKGEFNTNVYKYDVCSMYPSIMNSGQLFPIKEGEFKFLSNDEFTKMEYPLYGLYRCKIDGYNKLFKHNYNNYYTHIDIKLAKELKLNIELIHDAQPNFLYYSRDKLITGCEIFRQYVELLFNLKQKGIKKSKQILNILWGSLCETKNKTIHINNNDDKIKIIDGNIKIIKIKPFNDNETILEYVENDKQFYSNYARMKPFILSKARYILHNLIKNDINNIIWIHTDGWITKTENTSLNALNNLGCVKFEGKTNNLYIHNLNKIIGEFKI